MTVRELMRRLEDATADNPEFLDIEVCIWEHNWGWMGTDVTEDVAVIRYKPEGGRFLAIGHVRSGVDPYREIIWPKED